MAPRTRVFIVIRQGALVHIFCTEFPKNKNKLTSKEETKNNRCFHVLQSMIKTTSKLCNVME